MRPGRTVIVGRSIILAVGGMVTLLPTVSIFPSRVRIVWPERTLPESGSISLPARMAVIWADAGRSREQQVTRIIRKKRKANRSECSIIFFRHPLFEFQKAKRRLKTLLPDDRFSACL